MNEVREGGGEGRREREREKERRSGEREREGGREGEGEGRGGGVLSPAPHMKGRPRNRAVRFNKLQNPLRKSTAFP